MSLPNYWPGKPYWEISRARSEFLRWVCADCHLLSAEHPGQFWGCTGSWIAHTPPLPR